MSAYTDAVLVDSPVAYWRLGELAGTIADDETDNLDGTYVNTPTLGESGALLGDANLAIRLDGVNEWVNLDGVMDSATYNLGFTMEAWVKVDLASAGTDEGIVGAWLAASLGGPLLWRDHLTGRLRGVLGTGALETYIDTGHDPDGEWHYYAYTFDGATASVYVDGTVAAFKSTANLGGSSNFAIGRYNGEDIRSFAGWVDEVALYSTALSEARVLAHYEAGTEEPSEPTNQELLAVHGMGMGHW
jgi:Concanavalin A-like lectin/glucanases superfamily